MVTVFLSIFNQMEFHLVFLSILNQMEFHLVQNWKENCHHNHIPFNLKGIGDIVFSVSTRHINRSDWADTSAISHTVSGWHIADASFPEVLGCGTISCTKSWIPREGFHDQVYWTFHENVCDHVFLEWLW